MNTAAETTFDLFQEAPNVAAGTKEDTGYIDLAEIEPDPDQPRKDADPELEASIRASGVLQAIGVRPNPDPAKVAAGIKYRIVWGERRYRGSIAAGFTTIKAVIRDDSDEARRLIVQIVENRHKSVPPLDEAKAFKRVQTLTGASLNQLVSLLGIPKSTIADRLALADAPEPFQPLFEAGVLSASAAPIVRKYAPVPNEILQQGIETAKLQWRWSQPMEAGRPVPLDDVELTLDQIILGQLLEEIPEALLLQYRSKGGVIIEVANRAYATDAKLLERVRRDVQKARDEDALAKQQLENTKSAPAGKKGKATPAPTNAARETPKPETDLWEAPRHVESTAERRAREKREREMEEQRKEAQRYELAKPAILKAIADQIKKAPTGSRDLLSNRVLDLVVDVIHEFDGVATAKLVSRGNTSTDLIRFIVMGEFVDDFATGAVDLGNLPTRLQQLGLKVDLKKVLGAAPAATAPTAEKKVAAKSPAKKSAPKKKSKR
jgi:ParB family chromosome partitioning protein